MVGLLASGKTNSLSISSSETEYDSSVEASVVESPCRRCRLGDEKSLYQVQDWYALIFRQSEDALKGCYGRGLHGETVALICS